MATMKKLLSSERGYAAVLTLIFMPILIGLSLLVIDVARGNNAHTDLQAAADALAITGARELDGRSSSITSAKAAMTEIDNSVSFLGVSGASVYIPLTYVDDANNEFLVIFLEDIPDADDTLINQAFVDANATNDGTLAKYVYVSAQSQNLNTFFPIPDGLFPAGVPIRTEAVATYSSAACDVTPLFICNPFEGTLALVISMRISQVVNTMGDK